MKINLWHEDDDSKCLRDYSYYKCDATRYVRADVAMRYARMRERKGYMDGKQDGYEYCIDSIPSYFEAQKAAQRKVK